MKILSPYFSAGRFKDKILFKEMAKLLTKALVEVIPNINSHLLRFGNSPGRYFWTKIPKFMFQIPLETSNV